MGMVYSKLSTETLMFYTYPSTCTRMAIFIRQGQVVTIIILVRGSGKEGMSCLDCPPRKLHGADLLAEISISPGRRKAWVTLTTYLHFSK